jgi:hypothetical protein
MRNRGYIAAALLALTALTLGGCARNIVRAAPPSVAMPPPNAPEPRTEASAAAPLAAPDLAPPMPELEPFPTSGPQPPRPQPVIATADPAVPNPRTEVAAPQISPILSTADRQRLTRLTTDQVSTAERNLQQANGRLLNAVQNDLAEKVRGFLSQAHEAIRANDWVRAQNLAEKAQVLSAELVKSF